MDMLVGEDIDDERYTLESFGSCRSRKYLLFTRCMPWPTHSGRSSSGSFFLLPGFSQVKTKDDREHTSWGIQTLITEKHHESSQRFMQQKISRMPYAITYLSDFDRSHLNSNLLSRLTVCYQGLIVF